LLLSSLLALLFFNTYLKFLQLDHPVSLLPSNFNSDVLVTIFVSFLHSQTIVIVFVLILPLLIFHQCSLKCWLVKILGMKAVLGFVLFHFMSHGSVVSIATGYRLGDPGFGARVPIKQSKSKAIPVTGRGGL
jgi:hypothetical protein